MKIASVDWKSLDLKFLIAEFSSIEFRSLFREVLYFDKDYIKLTHTGDLKDDKPFKVLDPKQSTAHYVTGNGPLFFLVFSASPKNSEADMK
jgi:hypothetical protein